MKVTYEEFIAAMPKFAEFKFWFVKELSQEGSITSAGSDYHVRGVYSIYQNGVNTGLLGKYVEYADSVQLEHPEMYGDLLGVEEMIRADFIKYKERPEYIAQSVASLPLDKGELANLYQVTLLGSILLRVKRDSISDPDSCIDKFGRCIEWLRSTDFFESPASTQYHDAYPGGLVYHSLRVANEAKHLMSAYNWSGNRLSYGSVVLSALVHDWCKIGRYELYYKNVKNESTNKWEKVPAYKRVDSFIPLGHGVASCFLATKFFKLSTDETLAIRWHMGEYNLAPNEADELHCANQAYPLVFLIQFADRLAVTSYTLDYRK